MNFFSRMKTLAKSNTVDDLDAALADLDRDEQSDRAALAQLTSDLGRAVVAGDEAAATRIQAEKSAILSRLELAPIARAEIERRKAEAETAKAEADLAATMTAARTANEKRRAALKRLHLLFTEAAELLEAADDADKVLREANAKARAAGRSDLQVEAVEVAAARRRAKLVSELGTSLSPVSVNFDLGTVRLPGYIPTVEFDADREFMVRPLSLVD